MRKLHWLENPIAQLAGTLLLGLVFALAEFSDAWWPPALALGACMLALLWWWRITQREQRAVHEQMRLELHSWLMQQFGLPFTEDAFGARPPSASHVGTLKSHRVLREQLQLMPPDQHAAYILNATLIVLDEQGRHWLVLYTSQRLPGKDKAITLPRPPSVQSITELRARRALFNDPPAYQKAFGEAPTRAGLDAWRARHPDQDQHERERE